MKDSRTPVMLVLIQNETFCSIVSGWRELDGEAEHGWLQVFLPREGPRVQPGLDRARRWETWWSDALVFIFVMPLSRQQRRGVKVYYRSEILVDWCSSVTVALNWFQVRVYYQSIFRGEIGVEWFTNGSHLSFSDSFPAFYPQRCSGNQRIWTSTLLTCGASASFSGSWRPDKCLSPSSAPPRSAWKWRWRVCACRWVRACRGTCANWSRCAAMRIRASAPSSTCCCRSLRRCARRENEGKVFQSKCLLPLQPPSFLQPLNSLLLLLRRRPILLLSAANWWEVN